jgi:hypothetical protein
VDGLLQNHAAGRSDSFFKPSKTECMIWNGTYHAGPRDIFAIDPLLQATTARRHEMSLVFISAVALLPPFSSWLFASFEATAPDGDMPIDGLSLRQL